MNSNIVELRPHQVALLIAVFLSAFSAPLTIPFNIGTIISTFGTTRAEAGIVVTVEGVCISLASIICSRLIVRHRVRKLLVVGVSVVAVSNALTLLASDVVFMIYCRALAGAGCGIVLCVVMATAARTRNPEMMYGWISGSIGAFLSLLAIMLPVVISHGGLAGAYGLYTAFSVAGMFLVIGVPNIKGSCEESGSIDFFQSKQKRIRADVIGWIALLGIGFFYFGQAGIAAFVERIGVGNGISLTTIGNILFASGILTIFGSIGAGVVGSRFGSTKPLILVSGLLCVSVLNIAVIDSVFGYFLGVPMIWLLPAIMLPSFLGGLAVIDPAGRLAGAYPAFATMGGALGPVTAGAVADSGGFGSLGWFIVAMIILGSALMAGATTKANRLRVMPAI